MAGAMFLKASAAVAALCLIQLAAAGPCDANLPAATFNFPQMYNGNSESFDWLISLTTPSANTPAGDAACASAVYIGQYTPGSSDPAACITTAPTKAAQADGTCKLSFTQTDGSTTRTFAITTKCDASATTLKPPTAFTVTTGFGSSSFIYTGTFTSAAVCGNAPPPGPTPPGPNPPPGPTPPGGDLDFEKEPCSGGCAFLIVFFVGMFAYFVIAIVFNIVTGKRGREAAPHTDFWSEIPSLIKDGVMFLFRVITCRASAGAGYQQV